MVIRIGPNPYELPLEEETWIHREGGMKAQGEDGRGQAKERGLEQILPHGPRRSQPCWHLDSRVLASRTVRKKTCVV